MTRTAALAVVAALLAAGCSATQGPDGTEKNVFGTSGPAQPGQPGGYTAGVVPTGVIINFSIHPLHNFSGSSVTLKSARLISPSSPAIQVTSIRAYLIKQVRVGQLFGWQGDPAKTCPQQFTPHPVTDVTVAPHSDSDWTILLALIFKRPGKYRFGWARITYVAGGQRGWQNYYVGDTRITAQKDPQLVHLDRCGPRRA